MPEPGVYLGTVRHRRFAPKNHAFTFPLFMTLLDIDRLPEQMAVSPFTAYNRFNWASFHDADHLGHDARPIREKLEEDARRHGVSLPAGQVLLLTHLRYLGHVFNPVSFFYCFDQQARLAMVMAEVNNTYGGRSTYWLTSPTRESQAGRTFRTPKTMYVSPFMPVELDWTFFFSADTDPLVVHMTAEQAGRGGLFDATLRLTRRPWQAGALHRALLRFPAMTLSVIAAIHWQALRLYLKGLKVVPRLTKNGLNVRHDTRAGAPLI